MKNSILWMITCAILLAGCKEKEQLETTEVAEEATECVALPNVEMDYCVGMTPEPTESYAHQEESGFKSVKSNPLSTFSIDVDRASYSNIRRMVNMGQKPPADAVRIEEMINYFSYDYKEPDTQYPYTVNYEYATCPWNQTHQLLQIGLQGKRVALEDLPPNNLVFLIDVSGSMSDPNKLPLVKSSLKTLVKQLRAEDRIAIVVYAGAAGEVLASTSAKKQEKILEAIENLEAGGSTNGGEGLELAYKIATDNYIKKGNNRVILATDGDFNVGPSSDEDMLKLIEEKRETGVFMSCLGFGMGNLQDAKLEIIADKGNGNYAYIDTQQEAEKIFGDEICGTLFTIAKDVKIQIEFNPAKVLAYRLVGYDNRRLNDEDFKDDHKDAGEMGAGHTVTALYEIVPVGAKVEDLNLPDELKYQKVEKTPLDFGEEIATIKTRYKPVQSDKSNELKWTIEGRPKAIDRTTNDFRFASSVALWGMLLKESQYIGEGNWDMALELAKDAKGDDEDGFRSEMIRLLKTSKSL
ncbi:MAG: VWA domain-containing protein [Chitinophagales bacterium]|nr:VWA domain-containing protein [Chitinophagales bacterium]